MRWLTSTLNRPPAAALWSILWPNWGSASGNVCPPRLHPQLLPETPSQRRTACISVCLCVLGIWKAVVVQPRQRMTENLSYMEPNGFVRTFHFNDKSNFCVLVACSPSDAVSCLGENKTKHQGLFRAIIMLILRVWWIHFTLFSTIWSFVWRGKIWARTFPLKGKFLRLRAWRRRRLNFSLSHVENPLRN